MNAGRSLNVVSIACGVWFACSSSLWVYFVNLIISYPVGLFGIYLWYRAGKAGYKGTAHRVALLLHLVGLCISIAALFLFK
jgi:hypothetical protein